MSEPRVAIIGAGIVGITVAHMLTERGHAVKMFEKGPAYPYPHATEWRRFQIERQPIVEVNAPHTIKRVTTDGISFDIEGDRRQRVGGSATAWEAITLRMLPSDFQTRTRYGYGDDWPITYDDLEPYYGRAERMMGVSGTDDDNPFAPPRSTPYPLPPFELAHDDTILAEALSEAGIVLHSTPQARTRENYEGRSACVNYKTCRFCPIGARYSPNFHLDQAIETGLCEVVTDVSVRRIVPDDDGPGATLVYQFTAGGGATEEHFDIVIVAAGALESARLLLLSSDERHPDGLGNHSGWVGRGLTFHHTWRGVLRYEESLFPGRFGGWTGQSLQFLDTETRGEHTSVKVEFSSHTEFAPTGLTWGDLSVDDHRDMYNAMLPLTQWRPINLMCEADPSEDKYLTLSGHFDRFGDSLAHIHYRFTERDEATYEYARSIFDQFVAATRPIQSQFPPNDWWSSAAHHMGTCRMSESPGDGVVNPFHEIHNAEGVFVVGGGSFVGGGGAINPTLTMVALAMRMTDYILDQRL